MKIRDEQEWILFQQHVRDKGNAGMKKLLEIFIEWSEDLQSREGDQLRQYNEALLDHEAQSILNAGDIGQLFWMACQFWPNGNEFADCLTLLEIRMVAENMMEKLLAQQEQARQAGDHADRGADIPSQ
jgi:hypothetical protein